MWWLKYKINIKDYCRHSPFKISWHTLPIPDWCSNTKCCACRDRAWFGAAHFSWSLVELTVKEMHEGINSLVPFQTTQKKICTSAKKWLNISATQWKCRFLLVEQFMTVILVCREEKLKYHNKTWQHLPASHIAKGRKPCLIMNRQKSIMLKT